MPVPTTALNTSLAIQGGLWKRRALLIILMSAIAGVFWVDSRYPALLKRYHAGTQIKATGALTFSTMYAVDRSMPYLERVWRTTVNWLDANLVGMTFAFLFAPAALTFLRTVRQRRTHSRFLNVLLGTAAGVPLGCAVTALLPLRVASTPRE